MDNIDYEVLYGFLVPLGIGVLIGIERERSKKRPTSSSKIAGVRTFALLGLLGATAALIAQRGMEYMPVMIVGGVALLVGVAYYVSGRDRTSMGHTTEVAELLVFLLGFLAYYPETRSISVMVGIVAALLLAMHESLHDFAEEIKEYELMDTLKFAVISLIILPILPNRPVDPWGVVNPQEIWLLVVLICAISYSGYILIKVLGVSRGLALTGFLGGLSSSTAVTTAMAKKAKSEKRMLKPAAFAAIVASSVMFPRMIFEISVVNPSMLSDLLAPMALMFSAGLLAAFVFSNPKTEMENELSLDTPFALKPALKFAAFFLLVLVIQHLAGTYLGTGGLYAVSLFSGLADVDAITLSSARMAASGQIPSSVAVEAIVLAAMSNTIMKVVYAYVMGGKSFAKTVGIASVVIIAAGTASILLF